MEFSITRFDTPESLTTELKSAALQIGFTLVGVADAVTPTGLHAFHEWLNRGYAGELGYMERRKAAYEDPTHVLQNVRSIIMLAGQYRTAEPTPVEATQGRVSRYAWGDADYHDVLRSQLKQLAAVAHEHRPNCRTRGIVDTAPLLERDFARLAGLGWFGKNTMLINKHAGSWFFLAALLLDIELTPDAPHHSSHCGTCTRCLDACPTDAFAEPYVLDARKCISYFTIELRDQPIPTEFRPQIGSWLFGCDVCQDVCPWNRKAPVSQETAYQPTSDLNPADAHMFLQMNAEEFRKRFRGTPLERPGRDGLARNAAIVLGNSRDPAAVSPLVVGLNDPSPLVRGAVAWALGQLGGDAAMTALKSRLAMEDNADVLQELNEVLARQPDTQRGV